VRSNIAVQRENACQVNLNDLFLKLRVSWILENELLRPHSNPRWRLVTGMFFLYAGTIELDTYLVTMSDNIFSQARDGIHGRKIDDTDLRLPAQVLGGFFRSRISSTPLC